MGKTCFFIGSHDAPERIMEVLQGSVELHIIDDGVTDFYVGYHGNFDRMAARAVICAKQSHPHIRLILVRAYHPSQHRFALPDGFDESVYPEGLELVPRRLAILKANHLMIDRVDHLITYVDQVAGNSKKLVDYANRRKNQGTLKIEDIYKAALYTQKPWNLNPAKTVLLTSRNDSVVEEQAVVEARMRKLISDGFRVMIADLSAPFGQMAMEVLPQLRKYDAEYTICCCACRPPHERKYAKKQYRTQSGYLRLCAMADCNYFYENPREVLTSAGFICTEDGLWAAAPSHNNNTSDVFHFPSFLRDDSML